MEITGHIKVITPIQKFANDFYKRDVVVVTEEQYPQPILIEFLKNKADAIDQYAVGEGVTVSINLRGREWESPQGETRYFNSIVGWKIEKTPLSTPVDQNSDGDDDFIFDQ